MMGQAGKPVTPLPIPIDPLKQHQQEHNHLRSSSLVSSSSVNASFQCSANGSYTTSQGNRNDNNKRTHKHRGTTLLMLCIIVTCSVCANSELSRVDTNVF